MNLEILELDGTGVNEEQKQDAIFPPSFFLILLVNTPSQWISGLFNSHDMGTENYKTTEFQWKI